MKLRSLFLASIAALAMASCSNNEDEVIDKGSINAEKNAFMQFGFSYGNSTNTRAAEDETGLDAEQKFENALLVVAYNNEEANTMVKTIARADFAPMEDPATDGKYYQSLPFNVTAGEVNAYVILNPTEAMSTALNAFNDKNANPATVEAKLKELQIAAIADATTDSKFVMYGKTLNRTLADKSTTAVTVEVDRIVAKMREISAKTEFESDKSATGATLNKKATIKLTDYAFTNLTDKSNLVYQNDNKVSSFITTSLYDGSTVNTGYVFNEMGKPALDKQINYCFENYNIEDPAGSGKNITSVIYKATIVVEGVNDQDQTKNVYIYNNTIYDYGQLKAAYEGSLGLADNASIADFAKLTIRKYAAGVCYYRKAIVTTNEGNIIKRNNAYLLEVATVSKIGFPEPTPFDDPTMMRLNLTVKPWTVNENAFDL